MKKGFSLIEILAVIALLGVIITLATISITAFRINSQENLKAQKIKYIEASALRWGEEHLNNLSGNCYVDPTTNKFLSIQTLIDAGYIAGDDESQEHLLIPGTTDAFNTKCVCIKYENIFSGKDSELSSYNQQYGYAGHTNYQVTATYGEGNCN